MSSSSPLAFLIVVLAAFALPACAAEPPPPATAPAASTTAGLVANGDAKLGDKTRCPVSGDAFTVTDKSPHAEYNGKTYYFCCPNCSGKFLGDPQKYLAKPGA